MKPKLLQLEEKANKLLAQRRLKPLSLPLYLAWSAVIDEKIKLLDEMMKGKNND